MTVRHFCGDCDELLREYQGLDSEADRAVWEQHARRKHPHTLLAPMDTSSIRTVPVMLFGDEFEDGAA